MSAIRLRKNIKNYRPAHSLQWTPIIVTDSKGKYLRNSNTNTDQTDTKIHWYGRGGFTTTNAVNFLTNEKLRTLLRHNGRISIYIFLGTCDFTVLERKRIIRLRKPTFKYLRTYFKNINTLKSRCTSRRLKITFLQCPYYSIEKWNRAQGHENPSVFKDDDKTLTRVIDRANSHIDRVNREFSTYTPRLNQDLLRSRKRAGHKPRYSIRFGLLKDGIHPKPRLARSWLASIKRKINKDCGTS